MRPSAMTILLALGCSPDEDLAAPPLPQWAEGFSRLHIGFSPATAADPRPARRRRPGRACLHAAP